MTGLFKKFCVGVVNVLASLTLGVIIIYLIGDIIPAADVVESGVVVGKRHVDAHSSFGAGKPLTPQYYPEKWELCIRLNTSSKYGCTEVSQDIYESTTDGTSVNIVYFTDRWSNDLHIKTIRFL